MALQLTYSLTGTGWASAQISSEREAVQMTVSYLHDTLGSLTEAALALLAQPLLPQVIVFMDEPGEHQLCLIADGEDSVNIELRWFEGWQSWGMYPDEPYQTVLQTTTTAVHFAQLVKSVLDNLWLTLGPEQYKEQWAEHDFPVHSYHRLIRRLS